ncbi:Presequence protease, mitochondrial [Nakaseomyces bracarensis]|uniref:Presequence protease, mitochondrial n=1 Tax=Nakaseomyces bracarensis TaxID=273131 RepID=A0ABR4NTU6_9SACH
MLRFKRFASSQRAVLKKYPVGGILHGYEIRRCVPVPELKLTAVDLVHEQTGSEHLHIDREDKNNVFSIAFRTLPSDATGVPHILEHTTLCGSEKYPVRDPFFKMLNKSLANFMNAMTGPDYTFFPFATTNPKDFTNLRDVYLDATLRPLLKEQDFYQEGWRLENADMADPKSDIVYKGVVFNEMKGQVSNADYHFWSQFQQTVYPSLHNSGGDPQEITNLHYQDLLDFHAKNYHPSNSRTFTYGSLPLEDTLAKLNEEFKLYGKRVRDNSLPQPIKITVDKEVNTTGQMDPMLPPEKQNKSSMTWICGSPTDVYESFLLKVLGNLLLDGHDSIMYKKLIETGIGFEFTVNTGVESITAANLFTVGVQGVEDIQKFRQTVMESLNDVVETKFDEKKIEAIIQQLELSKKDQKADFGMQILYSILPGWTSGIDPIQGLDFDELLYRFRDDYNALGDKIFKDLINKYLLNSPKFLFTLDGSDHFSGNLAEKESQSLSKKVETLNEDDKQAIYKRGILLQAAQNEQEDLSCLPSVHISDIPRSSDYYPVETTNKVSVRNTFTNGITYCRGKKLINDSIPLELYPYLSLFAASLTHLGTSTEPYNIIENEIKLHTGGITTDVSVVPDPVNLSPKLYFEFSGWSLNSKTSHIFDILKKILVETDFKKHSEKLKVLIRSLASSNTAHIAESGHTVARSYSSAHLSTANSIQESLSGIEYFKLISRLNSLLENNNLFETEVIDKLSELQKIIIGKENLEFFVSLDSVEQKVKVKNEIDTFTSSLPTGKKVDNPFKTSSFPLLAKIAKGTLINFPFQVHYTAQSHVGVPYTHKDGAALQVLANMLTFKHLHKEIREKGGAYGGGATFTALSGLFNYYSYRDPHPLKSLATFDNAIKYVLNDAQWKSADIDEAKLSIFQQVDAPISPKSEGTTWFSSGVTDEMRQTRREQLLDTSLLDIHRVAEKYLLPSSGVNTVVGPSIENETVSPKWKIEDIGIETK